MQQDSRGGTVPQPNQPGAVEAGLTENRAPVYRAASRTLVRVLFLVTVVFVVAFTFRSALRHAVSPGMNRTFSSWSAVFPRLVHNGGDRRSLTHHNAELKNESSEVWVCNTSVCNQLASRVREQTKHSGSPCEDFYRFGCKTWESEHPLEIGANFVSADTVALNRYVDIMKAVVSSPDAVSNLEFLYRICKKGSDTLFTGIVGTFLHTLGLKAWPYTAANTAIVSETDFSYKVGLLHRVLGIDSIFSFNVDEDPVVTSRPLLSLGQPRLVTERGRNSTVDYSWLDRSYRSLSRLLGKDVRGRIAKLEMAFHSLTVVEYREPSVDYDIIEVTKLPAIHFINWKALIQGVLGVDLKVERVKVKAPRYLSRLYKSMEVTKADVLNYLVFRIMIMLFPFVKSEDVFSKLAKWTSRRGLGFSLASTREDRCLRFILDTEPYIPMYLARDSGPQKRSVDYLQNLLRDTVPREFAKYVRSKLGLPSPYTEEFVNRLDSVTWEMFAPKALDNATFRELYMDGVYVNNPKTPLISFVFYYLKNSFLRTWPPLASSRNRISTGWNMPFFETSPSFDPSFKILQIPMTSLDFSIPDDPVARWFHIPRLAFRVYRSLLDFLLRFARGTRLTNVTDGIDVKRSCLQSQYHQLKPPKHSAAAGNSETTSTSDLLDALSLRLAYEAFKREVSNVSKEVMFGSGVRPPYSDSQLFFVHYALSHCENSSPEHISWQQQEGTRSSGWFRVNGPLRNYVVFAQAFRCKPGTFMNAENSCNL